MTALAHHLEPLTTHPTTASFDNAAGLSDREAEIVRLVAQGYSNEEITSTVWLSVNTIKSYLRSAYRRMNVESRTQAVIWAFDHGLVQPSGDNVLRRTGSAA